MTPLWRLRRGASNCISERCRAVRMAQYLIILLLPFYLLDWINPLISDLSIGEDYQRFPIDIQLELLFAIETGTFPLFLPGALGGLPASSGILGQLYHPVAHVARLMPGYWDGHAMACNTLFRLMTLGCAHLAIYIFLRRIQTGRVVAFLLSLATVYNLRTMELFLYGASVETWTGLMFLTAAIGCYYLKPDHLRGALLIIGASYWLIASGHPQMTYHALTGVLFFTLALPFLLRQTTCGRKVGRREMSLFWMRTTCFCALGALLATASWLPFYYEFVKVNAGRIDQPYAWAVIYNDTVIGTLNNFIQPLRAGSGAFGGLPLFLTAMLAPALMFFRVKTPWIVLGLWGLVCLVFLYMLGPLSPVHYWCWKYIPLVSSFRMAGRISIVMPVLLLMIMIWVVHATPATIRIGGIDRRVSALSILSVPAMLLMSGYALTADRLKDHLSEYAIVHLHSLPPAVEWWALFWGLAFLAGLLVYQNLSRFRRITGILVCLLAMNQIMIITRYGVWAALREDKPTFAEMEAQKRETIIFRPQPGTAGISRDVARHLERFFLEPDLARIHHHIVPAVDNEDAYALLGKAYRGGMLVVEGLSEEPRIWPTPAPAAGPSSRVALVYSSYNRLVFETRTERDGFFLLGYPFTHDWNASINGQPVDIYRANGYAMAIPVSRGSHRVDFRRHGFWVRVGVLISTLTYTGLIGFCALSGLRRPWNRRIIATVLLIVVGFLLMWNRSLYHGRNLETAYVWMPGPPTANLAFAKSTRMSGRWNEYPELFNSPLAVNGVTTPLNAFFSPGSGFITDLQSEPWWEVDLGGMESVQTIRLHESEHRGLEWNIRPIRIGTSRDGVIWTWTIVDEPRTDDPITITFAESLQLRYLRVQASGFCRLSLSEVEVFPPGFKKKMGALQPENVDKI